mmetsp:Transcript_22939/g.71150  ORF Transcript_22939/g.71150 Transcript_22939/m.71150 type:complete len:202 (+) Transcript_22939:519-1124(+)
MSSPTAMPSSITAREMATSTVAQRSPNRGRFLFTCLRPAARARAAAPPKLTARLVPVFVVGLVGGLAFTVLVDVEGKGAAVAVRRGTASASWSETLGSFFSASEGEGSIERSENGASEEAPLAPASSSLIGSACASSDASASSSLSMSPGRKADILRPSVAEPTALLRRRVAEFVELRLVGDVFSPKPPNRTTERCRESWL